MCRTAKPAVERGILLPAGAGAALSARVEAQARHDHEDVAGVGVDRDPVAAPGSPVVHEQARGQRAAEQAGAGQGERHGARAVVAVVAPGAVAATPLVRELGDLVRGQDHALHDVRRVLGRHRRAVAEHPGARARLEEGRRVEVLLEGRERRARLAQLLAHLGVGRRARAGRVVGGVTLEGVRGPGPAQLDDLRLRLPPRLVLALPGAPLAGRLRREHDLLGLSPAVRSVAAALRPAPAPDRAAAEGDDRERRGGAPQPARSGAWYLDFHSAYGIP